MSCVIVHATENDAIRQSNSTVTCFPIRQPRRQPGDAVEDEIAHYREDQNKSCKRFDVSLIVGPVWIVKQQIPKSMRGESECEQERYDPPMQPGEISRCRSAAAHGKRSEKTRRVHNHFERSFD